MTIFYLVRHGMNDLLTHTLAGRSPGVSLNAAGRQQAERLVSFLGSRQIHRLVSSPLERARQTAEPLARALNLPIEISDAITEVDFGDWTLKTIQELESAPGWREWNSFRSGSRVPNGESMLEVQGRIVSDLQRLQGECAGQSVAIFSHGDPIRAGLLFYLGMPLDFIHRLEVSPASVTVLALDEWGAQLRGLNLEPAL